MSKFPALLCGLALSLVFPSPMTARTTDTRSLSAGEPAALIVSDTNKSQGRHKKMRIKGDFIAASRAKKKAIPKKAASSNLAIYANVVDCIDPGIYKISTEEYNFEPIVTGDDFITYGGAAYSNGIYLGVNSDTRNAYKWNADDWTLIEGPVASQLIRGTTMTSDPNDGTIYSVAYNLFGIGYELVTVDPDNYYRSSTIGTVDTYISAIFFDKNGTLWAFDGDGLLYTVSTTDATLTLKANTEIAAWYNGAAVVDPETGLCYYAVCDWDCGLYEVNLDTFETSLLYTFDEEEDIESLFLMAAPPDAGAPSNAQAFATNFEGGALSGTIAFTAPATTFDGSGGTGTLNYTLSANDNVIKTATCAWGESIEVPFTTTEPAAFTFSLVFSNDAGQSRTSTLARWIGNDKPAAVTNVKAKRNDGKNTITWDACRASEHGGYYVPEEVTYTVTRMPDNVVVAENLKGTTFTDNLADGNSPEAYTYEVQAVWNGLASATAKSNQVMVGVVYYNSFDELSDFEEFLSVGLVVDGPTWTYSSGRHAAVVGYDEEHAVSAWLISPALTLVAGSEYTLTFDTWCSNDSYNEELSVYITTSNAPAVIYNNTPIINHQVINWEYNSARKITATFTPETSGTYYLTFQGCSPRDYGNVFIDNVMLYRTPTAVLPAAPAITAELDGALTAKVSVTAPTLDTDGKAITALSRLTLSRDGELLQTYSNPTPGETFVFTETLITSGSYYYTAVAYNENGRSEDATALLSAVVAAKPMHPSSVTYTETSTPGEVTVSWAAPIIDVKGQPLQPGSITYNIYANDKAEPIATGLTETSYTYRAVPDGEQQFLVFKVSAVNSAGEGSTSYDQEPKPFGTPATLPFVESFAGMQAQQLWSFYNSDDYSDGEWLFIASCENPNTQSVDLDGGMLAFSADMYEDTAIATSGKIDLGDGDTPRLSFYYYANTDNKDILEVLISDGGSFKRLFTKVMRDDQVTGWVKATIDLSSYAHKIVQIRIQGTSQRSRNFMLVDKIEISSIDHDLVASALSVPSSAKRGVPFNVMAYIMNNGSMPATDYKVVLYRDGVKADEIAGKQLGSGAAAEYAFEQTPDANWNSNVNFSYAIEFAADQVPGNNTSAGESVSVFFGNYPGAENIKAIYTSEAKRAVALQWNAPDQANLPSAEYTEDFEFYTPFEADPEGDWTFVDGDGDAVFGSSIFPYENQNDPKAFVVLDSEHFNRTYAAHSGHLFLASFSASSKQSDDWMISPELTGEAQTVSLFARSYSDTYGLESFEILYSTTDKETSSFTKVAACKDVPTEWGKYSADLPAGAKYFAIRCVSDMRFAFFVDDVTFTPLVNPASSFAIEGYNIYRNGARLNQKPLLDTKYTDTALGEGEPVYNVSVVYDHGESPLSAPVSPILSALSDVESAAVNAVAVKGGIEISAGGSLVAVFSADGKAIFNAPVNGRVFVAASTGVYIVNSGKYTTKVIVR